MLYISAKDFQQDAYVLAQKIQNTNKAYDAILCITKGGMHLAYYLADVLGIKDIRTYCCSSYMEDNKQEGMHIYYQPNLLDLKGKNILVVDDLIDSGKTLKHILEVYPEYGVDVAVLYTKQGHGLVGNDVAIFANKENMPKDTRLTFYYEDKATIE